jgi:hypothetical protein
MGAGGGVWAVDRAELLRPGLRVDGGVSMVFVTVGVAGTGAGAMVRLSAPEGAALDFAPADAGFTALTDAWARGLAEGEGFEGAGFGDDFGAGAGALALATDSGAGLTGLGAGDLAVGEADGLAAGLSLVADLALPDTACTAFLVAALADGLAVLTGALTAGLTAALVTLAAGLTALAGALDAAWTADLAEAFVDAFTAGFKATFASALTGALTAVFAGALTAGLFFLAGVFNSCLLWGKTPWTKLGPGIQVGARL